MSAVATPAGIIKAMEYVSESRPEIKNSIIDDWQYMSAFEYFDRADEVGYAKFTDIGKWLAKVAKKPISLRDDLYVFFMTHQKKQQITKVKENKKQNYW